MEKYNQDSPEEIEKLLLGRRIVDIIIDPTEIKVHYSHHISGAMILDDGTEIYVAPNQGGCACSSGDYALTSLAKIDNVITSVRLDNSSNDYYEDKSYRIYVVADAVEINAMQIDGSDGNGYYGTGYELIVKRPS